MGHGTGVRIVSAHSVEITFQYRGKRCRESVRLANTKTEKGLEPARRLKATIDEAISLGKFDYLAIFPSSKRALRLSKNPGRAILCGTVFDEYLLSRKNDLRPPQWKDYSEYVRHTWIPYLKDRDVENVAQINLDLIQTWVDAQTVGIKRIRALLSPLRQALQYAKRKGYIEGDPIEGLKVERPKVAEDEDNLKLDPFTPAEIKAICAHLHPSIADMIVFWVWTGLRFGEIAGLLWSDVDFERGVIYIRRAIRDLLVGAPKTDSSIRTVELLAPALAAIKRQRQVSEAAGSEVWLNPAYHTHGGKYCKPIWFKWTGDKLMRGAFDPACEAAGVRRRTPRQCRHTFVSWQLSSGEQLQWVSETIGHDNIETTAKQYAKWMRVAKLAPGAASVANIPWD